MMKKILSKIGDFFGTLSAMLVALIFGICVIFLIPIDYIKYKRSLYYKNERKKYASDITDSQLAIIKPMLPKAGNKSKWEKRELINAVLYLLENGCKWRNLPHDVPPHTTVSNFYYAAVKSGLWEKLLAVLVRYTREKAGRKTEPSYGIIY